MKHPPKRLHLADPSFPERTLCGRRVTHTLRIAADNGSNCFSCCRMRDKDTFEEKTLVTVRLSSGVVNDAFGLGASSEKHRESDWFKRHALAVSHPRGPEVGIVWLITGWVNYALSHRAMNESSIGADQVLGKAWQRMGREILVALNGSLDRLDGGLLDDGIRDFAQREGVDLE
jgi:hypothetical protein